MNAKDLLETYHGVLDRQRGGKGLDWPPRMEAGNIAITTDRTMDPEDVIRFLKEFGPAEGWIGFQSKNVWFKGGKLPEPDESCGFPLSAECFNSETRESLHVRQDGSGGWLVAKYGPRDGEEYIFDCVSFIATDGSIGRLKYRRYWRIDSGDGVEPFAACFIGFGEE